MATDSNQLVARIQRGAIPNSLSRTTRQTVPPFLQKLYEMVSDSATDNLIRWSDNGDSFFVLDHERVAHDVLPRWFKHNNFASFVRQLNMYGFHKIPHLQQGVLKSDNETELWNFEHPNFHRGQPDLLCLITRKKQLPDRASDDFSTDGKDGAHSLSNAGLSPGSLIDINAIVNGIAAIKRHQATISADLNDLKQSNQHLWQEAIAARERHKKHQDTINKILKFLAGVFGNTNRKGGQGDEHAQGVIPRKRQRLMIEGSQDPIDDLEHSLDHADIQSVASAPTGSKIEHVEDDSLQNRFVDITSPSPAPSTATATSTPSISTPQDQRSESLNDADRNTLQSPPSQFPIFPQFNVPNSAVETSRLANGYFNLPTPQQTASSSMNLLTTTPQSPSPPNQEAVLQALLSNPTSLQRLMQVMNMQPQSLAMPQPPLPQPQAQQQESIHSLANYGDQIPLPENPMAPSTLGFQMPAPDSQTMSLLKVDDSPSYEPLLENADQLQKTYKDATDINAEVDSLQESIDSLIKNLGLDTQTLSSLSKEDERAHNDVDPVFIPPNSAQAPTFTSMPPPASTDQSLHPDMDSNSASVPDFDFNSFLSELNGRGDVPMTYSDFADPFTTDVQLGNGNNPGRLSAFVDEVASQSDASSPSTARNSLLEEPLNIPTPPADFSEKKGSGRKRKSDVAETPNVQVPTKPKRKR